MLRSSTTAGSRTLEKNIPVTLQFDIDKFYDDDLNAFNIVGSCRAPTRPTSRDIGAHFDSWHTGTSATDNAAGSSVMMEAMRLRKPAA